MQKKIKNAVEITNAGKGNSSFVFVDSGKNSDRKGEIKYFLNVNGAPFTFFYISKTNKINKLVNEVRSDESKRRKSIIFTYAWL